MKQKTLSVLGLGAAVLLAGVVSLGAQDRNRLDRSRGGTDRYDRDDRDGYRMERADEFRGHRSERQIRSEIRSNERRISRLERELRRLSRRDHFHGRGSYRGDRLEARRLEFEIRRLQERNHHLRGLLHRRW